jgi:hypothetical protein
MHSGLEASLIARAVTYKALTDRTRGRRCCPIGHASQPERMPAAALPEYSRA